MSVIKINYDLGEPIKNTETAKEYDLRKFQEGKTYSTASDKFSFEYKGKKYPSQYPHFCSASNYHDKKQKDFEFIIDLIRRFKRFLEIQIPIPSIIQRLLTYNSNQNFIENVGAFEVVNNLIKFIPSNGGLVEFNLDDQSELVFIKSLLFGNETETNNILDVIILYEKTLNETVEFSTNPIIKEKIKENFSKSTEIINSIDVFDSFNKAKQMPKEIFDMEKMDVVSINKNVIAFNYYIYKKNINKLQQDFPTYSTQNIFLTYLILKYFVLKNNSTEYKMKQFINEDGIYDVSEFSHEQIDLVKTFTNDILNTQNLMEKQCYVNKGMYFIHHEVSADMSPIYLLDFAYDLIGTNDLDKIKVSYLYFLGHECGHILMTQIWDKIKETLPDDLKIAQKMVIFGEMFQFEKFRLDSMNITTDNPVYKKYSKSLEHDINARDTGLIEPSAISESLADFISFLVVDYFIETNENFKGKNTKELLQKLFVSICDTYTAQFHADSFVRTNFFLFNENLADKILLGGTQTVNYKEKYFQYKNKYQALKNKLKN